MRKKLNSHGLFMEHFNLSTDKGDKNSGKGSGAVSTATLSDSLNAPKF